MSDTQSFKSQQLLSTPLDYLVIGHLTADITDQGEKLGGTSAFSALTASALGLKTGIISSFNPKLDISPLAGIWIKNKTSKQTTTFKNISNGKERSQYLYHTAEPIGVDDLPPFSVFPRIIHLGPVANELDPEMISQFPNSLKCMTPQGWFRRKADNNLVLQVPWQDSHHYLPQADIAVISIDDVNHNEELITEMAGLIPVLAVTEGSKGSRIYWHSEAKFFKAPEVKYLDDTGAGDIFATAFFYRFASTKDPWESGRFAVLLATWSVSYSHLDSIPTQEIISSVKMELIGD